MDVEYVDISRGSHLADLVGHSIGALSCFFLLSCLCKNLALYIRVVIVNLRVFRVRH